MTGKRELYKLFEARTGKKAFDRSSPFDVYRVLAEICVEGIRHLYCGHPRAARYRSLIAAVDTPRIPVAMQRVAFTAPHDLVIGDKPYAVLQGTLLEHGWEVVYNMMDAYALGSLLVEPQTRSILLPGTLSFHDGYIEATTFHGMDDAVTRDVRFPTTRLWAIPKPQYCRTEKLREVFPSYISGWRE